MFVICVDVKVLQRLRNLEENSLQTLTLNLLNKLKTFKLTFRAPKF